MLRRVLSRKCFWFVIRQVNRINCVSGTKKITIRPSPFQQIVLSCYRGMSDSCLQSLANHCRGLEQIDLVGCGGITKDGIQVGTTWSMTRGRQFRLESTVCWPWYLVVPLPACSITLRQPGSQFNSKKIALKITPKPNFEKDTYMNCHFRHFFNS